MFLTVRQARKRESKHTPESRRTRGANSLSPKQQQNNRKNSKSQRKTFRDLSGRVVCAGS